MNLPREIFDEFALGKSVLPRYKSVYSVTTAIVYKFWLLQPSPPCSGLQYSFSNKTSTVVSFCSMQGEFAESLLRKQLWRIEDFDCKLLLLLL